MRTGDVALLAALTLTAWGVCASLVAGALASRASDGWSGRSQAVVDSGTFAIYGAAVALLISLLDLWTAFVASDLSLRVVASHTATNLPLAYKVTAIWGGQAGVQLGRATLLAFVAVVALSQHRRVPAHTQAWILGALASVLFVMVVVTVLVGAPFERLQSVPPDGRGLAPALQDPVMLLQPLVMQFGLVACAVPWALTLAGHSVPSVAEGHGPALTLVPRARNWAAVAWATISCGLLGALWSNYTSLARLWAWDGVESVWLLAWLCATVSVHTLAGTGEGGLFRRWGAMVTGGAVVCAAAASAISRNGANTGLVELFRGPEGVWMTSFAGLVAGLTLVALAVYPAGGADRARIESHLSRGAALLANNIVLLSIALSIVTGALAPLVANVLVGSSRGGAAADGASAAAQALADVNVPLALLALALLAVGPLLPWRGATRVELRAALVVPGATAGVAAAALVIAGIRNVGAVLGIALALAALAGIANAARRGEVRVRQRGALVAHCGLALIALSLGAAGLSRTHVGVLTAGEQIVLPDVLGRSWTFVSQGISTESHLNRERTLLGVRVTRDGGAPALLRSEQRQYFRGFGSLSQDVFAPVVRPAIRRAVWQDVTVDLLRVRGRTGDAEVRITFRPLMSLLWLGGVLLVIGGVLAVRRVS